MEKNFEREVLDRLTKIETKLDDYKEIKNKAEVAYTRSEENKTEISELKDKLKWTSRTLWGAIITGLITILFLFLQKSLGLK